jgi:hypothetical protein
MLERLNALIAERDRAKVLYDSLNAKVAIIEQALAVLDDHPLPIPAPVRTEQPEPAYKPRQGVPAPAEIKEAALAAYREDRSLNCHDVAQRFNLGVATVARWVKQAGISRKPTKRNFPEPVDAGVKQRVIQTILANPDRS